MAKGWTVDQRNRIRGAQQLEARLLARIFLPGGTQYLTNDIDAVTVGGQVYSGAGGLESVSAVRSTNSLAAEQVTVVFDATRWRAAGAGDPAAILATLDASGFKGRRVELDLGLFDAAGHIVSVRLFAGRIDGLRLEDDAIDPTGDDAGRSSLIITLESVFIRYGLRQPRIRGHEDQRSMWSADDFYRLLAGTVANGGRGQGVGLVDSPYSGGLIGGGANTQFGDVRFN